ncbi:unnamed protein product [Lupinus luteus]|uniref:Uncharacterized protein n=1 Tax=Lupinus luteus TaxID=3873 RepID=A0AAV1YJ77_LUPLU
MAMGAMPASFSAISSRDSSLGFVRSSDFVRLSDLKKRTQYVRTKVMKIADKGTDIVRITVQGKKEADACFEIKNSLVQKNYNIPLVADIHFAPSVALRVAECFDKIRVNPGNFEEDYQKELEHIEQVFTPLVEKCKKYGRALRIGTNHGSLSDRIMSYYGDSPRGMVESAFEFARICRKLDFHKFIFSMKASNPVVMVQAYRLLLSEMYLQGWDYPLHLGVTEAGGEDGLGDTIRVSLTEPPEEEIDPCRRLASLGMRASELQKGVAPFEEKNRRYFDFQRRSGQLPVQKEGEEVDYRGILHRDGSVLMSVSLAQLKKPELLYKSLAAKLIVGMPFKDLATVDSILLRELPQVDDNNARLALKRLIDTSMRIITPLSEQLAKPLPNAMVLVNLKELSTGDHKILPQADNSLNFPVIHHIQFPSGIHRDDLVIGAGANAGALLVDGLGDGLLLEAKDKDFDFLTNTSFNLLQGCRMRNTKTEYVSCPSCGRTLFDLQEISAEIREKTSHFPGVSIAIMGCIVNGPGEMADADFGYVGGVPGKIDLYVGKERLRGATLGAILTGIVLLEQRKYIHSSISNSQSHSQVREPIFGKKTRSELAHSWNKAVDETFGPLIKSLSSRGW